MLFFLFAASAATVFRPVDPPAHKDNAFIVQPTQPTQPVDSLPSHDLNYSLPNWQSVGQSALPLMPTQPVYPIKNPLNMMDNFFNLPSRIFDPVFFPYQKSYYPNRVNLYPLQNQLSYPNPVLPNQPTYHIPEQSESSSLNHGQEEKKPSKPERPYTQKQIQFKPIREIPGLIEDGRADKRFRPPELQGTD